MNTGMIWGSQELMNNRNNGYLVPTVIEESAKGERAFDIFSRLMRDRIIMVSGEVTDPMSKVIISQLLVLEAEDPTKDITMYIDSPGGLVKAGLAMFNVMDQVKCDICTICVGQAASMGSFLLAGGTPGKRYAQPDADIMIHQLSGGSRGKFTDMKITWEQTIKTHEKLTGYLARFTNKTYEQLEEDMTHGDNFMTAEEALEYGLIDKILPAKRTPVKPIKREEV